MGNAGNDFVGAASLNGRHVTIVDGNSLTLGNVTATGNLNATAATHLALTGVVNANTLDLTANTGNITQSDGSTITVNTGPSDFNAGGSVNLRGTNSFTGAVNGLGSNTPSATDDLSAKIFAATVTGNFSPSNLMSSAS